MRLSVSCQGTLRTLTCRSSCSVTSTLLGGVATASPDWVPVRLDDPTAALRPMGKNFARAEAGLRCDLAPAHLVCGEREEACRQARETASSPRRPDLHASNAGSPSYSPCDTAATCPIAST